ncbi:hypothetical protein DAT36_14735 [Photobacterium phosphoreum]|nr:hypothetical protein DAT36_14735 [Photobacterium phosphoreum]
MNAGDSIDLVLVAAVPVTALDTDTIGVLLTAKAYEGTSAAVNEKVKDIGDNNDKADDTNADLIRITGDAVVNINKKATEINGIETESSLGIDIDGDTNTNLPVNLIRYEIDANNTGNKAAKDVILFDGVPEGTMLIKTSTAGTYNPISSGLLTINGDTPITTEDDLTDESSHGVDLDQDGTATDNGEADLDGGLDLNGNGNATDTGVAGIYGIDASLPPSSSISMTFYVAYSPTITPGDTKFSNTAYICADLDGDGAYVSPGECNDPDPLTKGPGTSNKVTTDSEITKGVDISDTGIDHNGDFTGNGGGDEDTDATPNDTQRVDIAAAGSEVVFFNIVTNEGNNIDIFNLSYDLASSTFPTDTIVEYWNATGTAKLLDTSSPADSIDDTGSIPASTCTDPDTTQYGFTIKCNQKLIRVVAKLPANSGAKTTESTMKVSATSNADPSKTDDKTESLGAITGPTVDVANRPFTAADMTANPAVNVDPVDVSNGFDNSDVATSFDDVALGSIVEANIYVANKGGTGDSFSLTAEGSYDSTATTWNTLLPAGWSVKFYDGGITNGLDGSVIAAATNTEITATATLAANAVQLVVAKIQVPTDAIQALADSNQPGAIDGNATPDGDKDYIISLLVTSAKTNAEDRKVESIDVKSLASIALTPTALDNQVQKGGTVNYQHTLTNTGNTVEVIEITSSNNKPDFTNTIRIDTDGDGVVDTELGNVCADDAFATGSVDVRQPNGVTILTIPVACDDAADTTPEFTLKPGEVIPLDVKVLTPDSAGAGLINQTIIDAVTTGGSGLTVSATDSTEIVDGMVRLSKFAALDSDCNGIPDTPKSFRVQIEGVEPGHCIIWKLIADNQGTTDAMNTVISDQQTEYTDFVTVGGVLGGLSKCINTGDPGTIKFFPDADYALTDEDIGALCNPEIGVTGGAITESIVGTDVTFDVGLLTAGNKAVGQFMVKVK